MATDPAQPQEGAQTTRECGPCRGTGRLVSNLGGSAHEVGCPWCEGTGTFIPEHDAQAVAGEADPGPDPRPSV